MRLLMARLGGQALHLEERWQVDLGLAEQNHLERLNLLVLELLQTLARR